MTRPTPPASDRLTPTAPSAAASTATGTFVAYPLAPSPTIHHPAREQRPVCPVRLPDGSEAFLVSRYADVRQVLTDDRFSRAAAAGPDAAPKELGVLETESLIGMDPPAHTRLRRLVARAFTPRRVEELRPRIAELVDAALTKIAGLPRPVDLVAHLSVPLPVQVISELLGVPEELRHLCTYWSDTMMGDWRANPAAMREALDGFAAMIAAKRDDPGDDLITALIAARDEQDRLTERELLAVCVGVLTGGHETTTNHINLSLLTLFEFPDQLELLRADPGLIEAAVEELSRFVQLGDTGILLPRVTTEEVTLGGVTLPAGATVLPAFVAANRDPAVFPDPDQLRLTRSENRHLGFGAGIHHCLGAQLARVELQEALGGLIRRFPGLRLAVRADELRFKPGLAVRSLERLPVTW
jgi:cytochrome P450